MKRFAKELAALIVLTSIIAAMVAHADPPAKTIMTVDEAIMRLQPGVHEDRAKRLAQEFKNAGKQHGFDPKFLVSVSFRESRFVPSIERRQRFGKSRNEIGLMQCHGAALSFRPDNCSDKLEGAYCQIQTGTRYLAHIRDNVCSGSTWRVLAAYGHGRCMSEYEARNDRGVKRVMRFYKAIGGQI